MTQDSFWPLSEPHRSSTHKGEVNHQSFCALVMTLENTFLCAGVCMCAGGIISELLDTADEAFRGPVTDVVKVEKTYGNKRLR